MSGPPGPPLLSADTVPAAQRGCATRGPNPRCSPWPFQVRPWASQSHRHPSRLRPAMCPHEPCRPCVNRGSRVSALHCSAAAVHSAWFLFLMRFPSTPLFSAPETSLSWRLLGDSLLLSHPHRPLLCPPGCSPLPRHRVCSLCSCSCLSSPPLCRLGVLPGL